MQQRLNSDLKIAGVLITQYDGRKNLNKSVSELVQETFQGKVFSTHIRNAITLAEAPTQGAGHLSLCAEICRSGRLRESMQRVTNRKNELNNGK